jgi:8-oxo-dGTP diphosphatase
MNNHKNPDSTVDVILQKDSHILLIRRKKDPFKDHLALPGGFINIGELVEDAMRREAKEETSLEIEPIDILGVYSDPQRDPRKHILSIVFVGSILQGEAKSGDDSIAIEWVHIDEIKNRKLGFDHNRILSDYKKWKQSRGTFWSSKSDLE